MYLNIKNRFSVAWITQLMFNKINGSPLYLSKSEVYVKSCLLRSRSVYGTIRSKKVSKNIEI